MPHAEQPWRFCVAPMMDWTDRHERYFLRLISRHARLYTEMVTADAVIHGDRDHLIGCSPQESPVALQLGGSEPAKLAQAARIGAEFGYDEINLNVGCPSDRVQSGRFGACLMKTPALVADCVSAMRAAVSLPVTVKCRLGVDEADSYEHLLGFVDTVAAAGCGVFIVHARKAWLSGLSPKQNREIPPLHYDRVHRLKAERPELTVVINGGLDSVAAAAPQLAGVDGVMLGRAAYKDPWVLAAVDPQLFASAAPSPTRDSVVERLLPYIAEQERQGVPVHRISRHILGLYNGCPGARNWRRRLSAVPGTDGVTHVRHALAAVAA